MSKFLALAGGVERSIHVIRGQRVMLDEDLARLYGVPTGRLNEAVKRNQSRFPEDFAFRLTTAEVDNLKSQSATSRTHGGRRRSAPMAFTEQGVAMLSSVLSSERAVAVNIEIMRTFVKVRQAVAVNAELAKRLAVVEAKLDQHRAESGKAAFGDRQNLGRARETHPDRLRDHPTLDGGRRRGEIAIARRLQAELEARPHFHHGFSIFSGLVTGCRTGHEARRGPRFKPT